MVVRLPSTQEKRFASELILSALLEMLKYYKFLSASFSLQRTCFAKLCLGVELCGSNMRNSLIFAIASAQKMDLGQCSKVHSLQLRKEYPFNSYMFLSCICEVGFFNSFFRVHLAIFHLHAC